MLYGTNGTILAATFMTIVCARLYFDKSGID